MGNFLKLRWDIFGDIFCNQGKLGVFWYVQDKTLFSKVNLCYQGGCFLSSKFEMACAQNFQAKIGILFNWLQV
jgi:hypothetical protein